MSLMSKDKERRNPHPQKEVRRRQLPKRIAVCNCALESIVRRSGSRAHWLVAAGTHSEEGDAPGVGCRTRPRLPNEARRSPAWGSRLGGYRPNSQQRSPAHASALVAVGRMQIFHVDLQPLVKACNLKLLVLADRCGEAENFLKLVGVLLHRSAILTDVGEHAKGVSPEARSEAKVASLLEVPPRDGRIFQLQAKAYGSSRPSKRGNSNRANFGAVAAGTSDSPVACASSAGGRLPCWLPESSVAGPFPASSYRISPCSVCIAVTAAWRVWTDSAEAYSPMTSGFDTKFVVGSGS
nr:hypothetical protein Iba_chr11bCG9830 [Ipomoea batatas]